MDRRSGVAAYMQIVQQTRDAIRLGRLVPNERLPSAREVVMQTAINPNTVQKAYRQLEFEGWVEGRAGSGTYVVGHPVQSAAALEAELSEPLRSWLRQAQAAGYAATDVRALTEVLIKETFGRD